MLAGGLLCATVEAQTLARPNWAGSGLSAEPWWRSAVFYRIAPANFQDSGGEGEGDLRGVAQRLEYIQSLGVDAVVLEAPFDDNGFDDLISEAGRHRVRLLVMVSGSEGGTLMPRARQWLMRGAAGLWFRPAPGEQPDALATEVRALRSLADGFPGERIVVEDTSGEPSLPPAAGAELVVRSLEAGELGDDAALLRARLADAQAVPPGSAPLLTLREKASAVAGAEKEEGLRRIAAAVLFASRATVALAYGQEIGLASADGNVRRLMPWTLSNVTQTPAAETSKPTAPARREDVYGSYVPYVQPAQGKAVAMPATDFDAKQGFTSGKLPEGFAADGGRAANVAAQDADAGSLLNFVRRLAQLHHGNAAMRGGGFDFLARESDGVLVLLRRPPATDRTSTAVVIGCNLTGQRLTVSLKTDMEKLKVRGGYLRPLLVSPAAEARIPQSTDSLVLAPWGTVIAQVEYE